MGVENRGEARCADSGRTIMGRAYSCVKRIGNETSLPARLYSHTVYMILSAYPQSGMRDSVKVLLRGFHPRDLDFLLINDGLRRQSCSI